MKRRNFLEKLGLSELKINAKSLEAEFSPNDPDTDAAWEVRSYTTALAAMAAVEDLSWLEQA